MFDSPPAKDVKYGGSWVHAQEKPGWEDCFQALVPLVFIIFLLQGSGAAEVISYGICMNSGKGLTMLSIKL
jgi:hypothetical protein